MTRSQKASYLLTLLLFGIGLGLPFVTPFVSLGWRMLIMNAYHPLCHQLASRSFAFNHIQFAVCHRCTGIYVGIFSANLLYLVLHPYHLIWWKYAKICLGLAALPLVLDWGLDALGWWSNTPESRFVSGLILGLVVGYYAAYGVGQMLWELLRIYIEPKPLKT
jgi:uncharacterized membrane protein